VDEAALLAEITSGASYHEASVRLLGRWARQGVAFMDARQRVVAAMEAVFPPDRDERWQRRFDDIDRCLEDIYGKEAKAKDAGQRTERTAPRPPAPEPEGEIELTEHGVAVAFAGQHKDGLRFCHHAGRWLIWTGARWERNETKRAFSWARALVARLNQKSEFKTKAITGKAAFAAAVERFAQADEAFAVTSEVWDRDPMLLGTPGGTVELRSGTMRPARQTDYITKSTAAAPAERPDCPRWLAFLEDVAAGDQGLIRFIRQRCGYTLTGDTREHALLFVYGPGGNGKSVLLNTVAGILGDYCRNAAMETFTAAQGDRHPTDLAMLQGARMVCASETEEGRAWAEVRIKQLTGGDTISARFMRQDFFEFRPQFKLVVIGNHKPVLRNVDEAARRRFNVVPFTYKPATPDRLLEEKLRAEWPAILRWMIEGCLDWQKNSLVRPAVVVDTTDEYFHEQDTFRQWIEDCCDTTDRAPHVADTNGGLFASWRAYAGSRGEEPGGAKRFVTALQRHGFKPIKDTAGIRGRGYQGLRVKLLAQEERES
jgi:putative DNA primase/helicase